MGIQKCEGQLLEKSAKIVTFSPLARNNDLILPQSWLFNPLADKEHDIWPPLPPTPVQKPNEEFSKVVWQAMQHVLTNDAGADTQQKNKKKQTDCKYCPMLQFIQGSINDCFSWLPWY